MDATPPSPPTPERPAAAPPAAPRGRSGAAELLLALRWPLAAVVIVLGLAVLGFLAYRETLQQAGRAASAVGDLARDVKDGLESVAGGFLQGDVTETFLASIPEIHSTGTGNLEVAIARATETFRRTEERRALWSSLPLGTTVSEIRVPVTYRYHLRLDDPWRVEIRDHLCIVHAPAIRPSQPPAIDTSRMVKRLDASLLHLNGAEQLAALERTITPRLEVRAGNPAHLGYVRPTARDTVAEFVRRWLLHQEQWGGDGVRAIQVVFADEDPASVERRPVTLTIERGSEIERGAGD